MPINTNQPPREIPSTLFSIRPKHENMRLIAILKIDMVALCFSKDRCGRFLDSIKIDVVALCFSKDRCGRFFDSIKIDVVALCFNKDRCGRFVIQ